MQGEPDAAVVLNVDDDDTGRYAITRVLEAAGHIVVEAGGGQEALARAAEQPVDVIVLDVHMPDMDGFEVAQRLKGDPVTADVPILHLSATARDSGSISSGLAGGADAYLTQPVSAEVLLATVGALVRARRALQEAKRRTAEAEEATARLREVQAREEAEHALFAATLEQMPAGALMADAEGRLIMQNERAKEIFGLAEIPARAEERLRVTQARTPEGTPLRLEDWPLWHALHTGERVTGQQIDIVRGDDTLVSMHANSAPIRNAQGVIIAAVAILVDVTDRKRAEEQREQQARLLQTIQESVPHAVAYLDRALRFVQVNSVYARAMALPAEEIVGRTFAQLIPHQPELVARLEQVVTTGRAADLREVAYVPFRRPELRTHSYDLAFVPVRDEQGRVEGVVVSASDVTGQVRQREQLLAAERARAELAETLNAEISHRTKNNLSMAASMLQLQAEQEDPHAAGLLGDAAGRLLTLASIHEQLQTTQEGQVDLLAALRRIAEATQEVFGAGHVEFTVEGEPTPLPSKMATNLAVVANELITNAAKHGCSVSPARGCQVRVHVEEHKDELRLSVWNSGNPIPADFPTGKRARLGLRLVTSLVEGQYGGRFTLTPEGGGTRAEIDVPLAEAA